MDHARMIALDSPANLKAALGGDVVQLWTADDAAAVEWLRTEGRDAAIVDGAVRLEVIGADEYVPSLLVRSPFAVRKVDIARPSLNDVFLRMTGRAIRDDGADARDALKQSMQRRGGRA